ncbi:glyoxalase [Rhodococcoides kyotonense]|uniref:Glyoxalase n=1 Tax=Rhodococcoides kyotonense TaxID=398843 RepID=A0A239EXX7_9NOCA|nr:glyoxalase [Rhodococcus kyotonensis]SNS49447.1 hypothetical protein SAMN05421642_1031 [Rhodococcus kyotonensis]
MPETAQSLPAGVVKNETIVPLLPCMDADATSEFWTSLGFTTSWNQRKPYLYLAFAWSGFELHYGRASANIDPADEVTGGCIVMVDDVASYHAFFLAAMRATHGKVLSKGRPRITRYRPGASRFSIVDPNGNTVIFIQRDEPAELEYGGSKELSGLAKAIDNARILREFKTDDLAASRALRSGLKRYGAEATVVEQAVARAGLVELFTVLDDADAAHEHGQALASLPHDNASRAAARAAVTDASLLNPYLD